MLNLRLRIAAALLSLAAAGGPALAADPTSADYKAGYEAGYQAALEALRAGTTTPAGALPAAAPATPPAAGTPAPAAAPKPTQPPDWWNHSALIGRSGEPLADYRLDPAWKHRVELQLSGTNVSGNDNGFAVRAGGKLFSRSGRWTNELMANVDRRRIVQAGQVNNQRDVRSLQESVRYDLTDRWYASAGLILERDDINLIDSRTTVLAGLGNYLVDNDRFRLNVFGGLGRLRERYMEPVPELIGLDRRSSGLLYLYQTFDWQINADWSLQQGFRHMRDLDDSGIYDLDPARPGLYTAIRQVKRYRNVGSLALTYQLNPRSSLSLSVESRYDSNPWPDVQPHDITRRLVLNLTY